MRLPWNRHLGQVVTLQSPCAVMLRNSSSTLDLELTSELAERFEENSKLSLECNPTLVLNADYTPMSRAPLSVMNWKDAFRIVYSGRANVVSTYDSLFCRSVTMSFPLPSVIALRQYQPMHRAEPVLTRRNVFMRDNYRCGYCGEQHGLAQLTLDHVIPRSKGGGSTWNNVTTACIGCNQKKGSNSLKELRTLGIRLKVQPRAPSFQELQTKRAAESAQRLKLHPHWRSFCLDSSV